MITWVFHTKTGELTAPGAYFSAHHIKTTKKKYFLYADEAEKTFLGFLKRSEHFIKFRT